MKGKTLVLRVISIFILLLGVYLIYELYTQDRSDKTYLLGIGPIICGIALLVISGSKPFKE